MALPGLVAVQLHPPASTLVDKTKRELLVLGLVGHRRFAHQTGLNEALNHAGNVLTAALSSLTREQI
ncbi:hypothetical protein [Hymenobacter sp. UYP22]|uniref:hypothetical protein n=1 Tax=Hymenobacter sp. UYP22 TaxID=3156348 RepID=UPI003394F141